MTLKDYRGYDVTGATPVALEAFEQALAAFQSWRNGADKILEKALHAAPSFTMAHIFDAYLCLGSRDVRRVRMASLAHAQALSLARNDREHMHIAAMGAALADDYASWKSLLGVLLQKYPRDVLALQIAHSLDYLTGDAQRLADRVPSLLPAWSSQMPGYHAVLAMLAFSMVECADYPRAVDAALNALQLNPFDARAHHALAHVYEMTDDPAQGLRWMTERVAFWNENTMVSTHGWWHVALFHLTLGQIDRALLLYDSKVRAGFSLEIADLIDASALLWRIELLGGNIGARWRELAAAWQIHIADGFCSFNDIHAMIAFVGARDWANADAMRQELARCKLLATRHGDTTRHVGFPACQGLIAFGRGDYGEAIQLLGTLPTEAHRIGGSHAQRDVLYLTMVTAIQRFRRPQWRIAA